MNATLPKDKYIRPEEASRLLKVTPRTIVDWNNKGKLRCARTKGGHRRILLSDVLAMLPDKEEHHKRCICYCRVSSHGQKEDLERQIKYLSGQYPDHEIISDIGSGINFKRKGFNTILDEAIKGNIGEVVVTHRDRLCRFGFDLIERIIDEHSQGSIVVLDQTKTSPQEELVNDLLSIITVFSSRLYGLRSHQLKNKVKAFKDAKDPDVPDGEREEGVGDNDDAVSVVL